MGLKFDLLNKLATDKYLCEIELYDALNSTALPYRERLWKIESILGEIIMINSKIDTADRYIIVPETPNPENLEPAPNE